MSEEFQVRGRHNKSNRYQGWRNRWTPVLETLEDRNVPATLVWEGDVSTLWNDGTLGTNTNWVVEGTTTNAKPVSGDKLIFPAIASNRLNNNNINGLTNLTIVFEGIDYAIQGNFGIGLASVSDTSMNGVNIFLPNLDFTLNATQFNIANATSKLVINGGLHGSNGLTKTGAGVLEMAGGLNNTYTGDTIVENGTLLLSKTGSEAIAGGMLRVGDGIGAPISAVVRSTTNYNLDQNVDITVSSDGLFSHDSGVLGLASDLRVFSGGAVMAPGLSTRIVFLNDSSSRDNSLRMLDSSSGFNVLFDNYPVQCGVFVTFNYDGGAGTDTLFVDSPFNFYYNIAADSSGEITNGPFRFKNVENYIGGGLSDIYNVVPNSAWSYSFDGGPSSNSLTIDLAGVTNPVLTLLSDTSGIMTFDNRQSINYTDIGRVDSINGSFRIVAIPNVTAPANQTASEGTGKVFNLGSFTDANNSNRYNIFVNWGDGSTPMVFPQSTTGAMGFNHTYVQDGSYTVTVTVLDADDGTADPISFNVNVGNVLPGLTPPANQTALLGINQSFSLGSFTDPGADAAWNATIIWGDGSANTTFQMNAPGAIPAQNHTFANSGNYTVTVRINDDDGSSSSTFQVNVANPIPVVTPPANQPGSEGTSTNFNLGSFVDANNSGNYNISINWGDGTPNTNFSQTTTGAITFQNHTFSQDGNFPVTITVADVNGTSIPVSFTAIVRNVSPITVDAPDQNAVATIAKSFTLGSFSDPGADAPWNITVNWGDGTANGNFTVNTPGTLPPLTHTFATAGTFNVVVTVSDDDSSDTSSYLVHVIPPIVHLQGEVFRDFNANGIEGPNDIGQSGVTIFVDRNGNELLDANEPSTVTNAFGQYTLDVNFEGAINIREVVPVGFKRTTDNPTTLNTVFSTSFFTANSIGNARIITPTIAVASKVGTIPVVQLLNADGSLRRTIVPFGAELPQFKGEVRVATGDFNDDGMEDVAVAAGPGGGPFVRIFDGNTNANLGSYFVDDTRGRTGLFVAAGDVNGDGKADLITGLDGGALPRVKVFDNTTRLPMYNFLAFPSSFKGGVRVAAGDVNGDGFADIITTSGPGAGAGNGHVKVFDGTNASTILSFKPNAGTNSPGYFIAAGDLDGDGKAEIITGSNSGTPTVMVFNHNAQKQQTLSAFTGIGGVRVAAKDLNGDGKADLLFASGIGQLPRLRSLDSAALLDLVSKTVLDGKTRNGVFVG